MSSKVELQVKYEVKVFDPKTGKVIKKVKGKSGSFNQNFARLLAILMFPRGDAGVSMSITDRGGTARTMQAPREPYSPLNYVVATGYRFEVGVGRSNVAFSRTQYNLLDPLGWVDYSTYSITDDGTKVVFRVSGSWYNATGVTQTAQEIGMTGRFMATDGSVYIIMIARDVITPTDVPDGLAIAISYEVTIPF